MSDDPVILTINGPITQDMADAIRHAVTQHQRRYWVAEQWDNDGTLNARWTTEHPGKTGPANLASILDQLRDDGWHIYETTQTG